MSRKFILSFSLIKKCNDTPPFQPFNDDTKEKFIGIDRGLDFFSPAEKLYLIKKELDALRAESGETIIPGHQKAELYKGKSIIRRMISCNIISSMQPVHDREQLGKLRASWLRNLRSIIRQPLGQLDDYFGSQLGLYFNFIETYAFSLACLLLGIILSFVLGLGPTGISLMTTMWSFGFILAWRQRQTTRAYTKGILNSIGRGWEEARPEHFGQGNHKLAYESSSFLSLKLRFFYLCIQMCIPNL